MCCQATLISFLKRRCGVLRLNTFLTSVADVPVTVHASALGRRCHCRAIIIMLLLFVCNIWIHIFQCHGVGFGEASAPASGTCTYVKFCKHHYHIVSSNTAATTLLLQENERIGSPPVGHTIGKRTSSMHPRVCRIKLWQLIK